MQATIEKVSNLERRLNVTLPSQEIEAEVENRLKKLARNVRMHGFRPGQGALPSGAAAVRRPGAAGSARRCPAEDLRRSGAQPESARGGLSALRSQARRRRRRTVEFSATFEIYPEIELGDMTQVTIERPVVEVERAEVDKTIEILRKQRVHYHAVDRGAREWRSDHDRLHRHARRAGVRGRQRERPHDRAGRRAAAGRLREGRGGIAAPGKAVHLN